MRDDLIERARQGDRDAFGQLAAREIDRLHAIARLILRDGDLAEDAVQEALIRCWRQLPKLRDVASFDAWLYRILVRAAADESGRRRRFTATVQNVRLEPSVADETSGVADRDERELGFRRLPSRDTTTLSCENDLYRA
jgi:RNA polymerase sigma-70 factor, ECF subfamily